MGPRQPHSASINFRDVWSRFRQLPLFTGEIQLLGSCMRGDSNGEAAPAGEQAEGMGSGRGVPAPPLTGCVTLSKSLNLFQPVSSSAKWRLSSLPHQVLVEVMCIVSCLWTCSMNCEAELSGPMFSLRPPHPSLRSAVPNLLHFSDPRAEIHHPQSPLPAARASCPAPAHPQGIWWRVEGGVYSALRKYALLSSWKF